MKEGTPLLAQAVTCQNLTVRYGRPSSKNPLILNSLNMNIGASTIYGLLGPSGCGKTTLLKCILGTVRHEKGSVLVFGKKPGTNYDIQVPGKDVGYMPQDLALHVNFKIKEIFYFYAKLNGMTFKESRERLDFLMALLDLPNEFTLVENLSGGQKRRVSFGAALIHKPKLLVLDEPTVGVDPVLRAKIWKHLLNISGNHHTTILITTHYIEEARQAQTVGLMRKGSLLVEGDPEELIEKRGLGTLEAVFLQLCGQQKDFQNETFMNAGIVTDTSDSANLIANEESSGCSVGEKEDCEDEEDEGEGSSSPNVYYFKSSSFSSSTSIRAAKMGNNISLRMMSLKHVGACVLKNLIGLYRSKALMAFQFLLPFIQISIFLLAVGANPKHVPVGIANEDQAPSQVSLSDHFISYLDGSLMKLKYYDSYKEAKRHEEQDKLSAILHFGSNFTLDLIERGMNLKNSSVEVALGSSIYISVDRTVLIISLLLQESIAKAYARFMYDLIEQLSPNTTLVISPINITTPLYGEVVHTFTDYMAPGVILQLTYAMSVSLTGIGAIMERKLGLVDRLSAAKVTEAEMMLALIIVQCIIMSFQIAILYIMALLVFQTPFLGSIALALFITYLQGLSGLCFGLIISSVCNEEVEAVQLALGTFYPIILLSGIIWPLESIPSPLIYLSYLLPPTLPADAIRNIFLKGWGISHYSVWSGILVNVGFIVVFLSAAMIIRKIIWYRR